MKNKLGCIKSPVSKLDYIINPLLMGVKDEEQEIDFTKDQSPVKHQKDKGACVGFSGVAGKEYQEYKETGNFLDLSEQWLYEKARLLGGYEEGATLIDCFKILSKQGVPLDKFWRYTTDKRNIGSPKEGALENASIYRISDKLYFRLTKADQIRATLLKYGPIQIGVKVYKNWYRQKAGHIPNASLCERVQGALGGHAIWIVGHSPKNKEYKFKNSWGTKFGDKGYGYLTETDIKRSFMDAFAWVDIKNVDFEKIERVSNV